MRISILFCFLSVSFLNAQNKVELETDDYCEEWGNKTNIISDHREAIKLNNEYLSKASKTCQISIHKNTAYRYMFLSKKDSAYYFLDKSIALSKEIEDDYLLASVYFTKANIALTRFYDGSDTGEQALIKCRELLTQFPGTKGWIGYYGNRAILSAIKNQPLEGIKYSDSSIVLAEKLKINIELGNLYHNRGWQYFNLGQYDMASKDYIQALELKKKYGSYDIVSTYSVLSSCLIKLKQWENAEKYVKIGMKLSKEEKNEYIMLRNYIDLSDIFMHHNLKYEAEKASDSALILAKKLKNLEKESIVLMQKANITYRYYEDDSKVKELYIEAYSKAKTTASTDSQFNTIMPLIEHLIEIKDFTNTKRYLSELQLIANETNKLIHKTTLHRLYSSYFQEINNTKQALFHQLKYATLKDSLSNTEMNTNVAILEKQYDTKSKELEIVKLDKEKTEQEQIATKAEAKQNIYFIIALVLLSLLLLGFWLFKKLKKQKEELASTNKVKNRLFSIIAHDLRGMIIPFQRSGRILTHYIEEKNYDKTIVFSQELQKNAVGLSNMLDNLLSWSLEQMNGYKMNPEVLYINKELEEIKSNFSQQSEFKNTKIDLIFNENIALTIDKGAFHIIFRNLIGNALKYTENGSVRIEFNRAFNILECSVTDTGVGMSQDQIKHIFSVEDTSSSPGTKGEKGTGLGLSLVRGFVTLNGGTIKVSSEKRAGTKFNLTFPLSEHDILETQKLNRQEASA